MGAREREVFHCNLPGRLVTGTPIDDKQPTKARARRVAEKTAPKTDELFSDKKNDLTERLRRVATHVLVFVFYCVRISVFQIYRTGIDVHSHGCKNKRLRLKCPKYAATFNGVNAHIRV